MRNTFINTLQELAGRDPRIMLLTGDLGYLVMEPFRDKCPGRFYNVGVAEQNMVGMATGLAEAGFIPFVYSIVTFATLRPYEFIRNGPILQQLPVRIVGVGGGLEYGHNGATHYGLEDVGVMRAQPGITVIAPADYLQTATALHATWNMNGPIYFRLGKDDKTSIPGLDGRFELGRAQIVREGRDILFVSMGSISIEVAAAAEKLAAQGIESTVMIVASVNPPPVDDIAGVLRQFSVVLTVEAHYTTGGVGSLVSEIAAEQGIGCRVVRCGVKTVPDGRSGSQNYMYEINGISSARLVKTALDAVRHNAAHVGGKV